MIAFRYTKTDGAEYLSHLDLLRHVDRTLKRAGIEVAKSGGFHPHPKIYMNNPLGLGVKSIAEYCAAECNFNGDFKEVFNAHSPDGIKCVSYKSLDKNPNYAYAITSCGYVAEGLKKFDTADIFGCESIIITDGRGREVDIRPRILKIDYEDGKTYFTLGCGQNNLRPDVFCKYLENMYGGKARNVCKLSAHGEFYGEENPLF